MTTKEKQDAERRAIEVLGRIVGQSDKAWTLTDFGKGQTDYVRVFALEDDEIREITYYVGQLTDYRTTDRGLALGGGNYSKALDVYERNQMRYVHEARPIEG